MAAFNKVAAAFNEATEDADTGVGDAHSHRELEFIDENGDRYTFVSGPGYNSATGKIECTIDKIGV